MATVRPYIYLSKSGRDIVHDLKNNALQQRKFPTERSSTPLFLLRSNNNGRRKGKKQERLIFCCYHSFSMRLINYLLKCMAFKNEEASSRSSKSAYSFTFYCVYCEEGFIRDGIGELGKWFCSPTYLIKKYN